MALGIELIFTTFSREIQHVWQRVIGCSSRKDVAVSQRLCFERDLSPQNSKSFWRGRGVGEGQEEFLPLKQGLSLCAFQL